MLYRDPFLLMSTCLLGLGFLATGADAIETTWSDDFALTGPDGKVSAAISSGDRWILGGSFHSVAGQTVSNLAVLEAGQWSPLDPGLGMSGTVNALAELPDGRIVVGGYFSEAGGEAADCLAIWDGTSWEGITGISDWDRVYALQVDQAGALWVGGSFVSFNGVPATGVMRLVNGVRDPAIGTPFDNTEILDPTIWDFALDNQGRVLAAGWLDRVNGQASAGVARWDGSSWDRLGATHSGGGNAYDVDVRGEEIWVAGYFTSWNALPVSGLVKLEDEQWIYPGNPFAIGFTELLIDGDDIWAGNGWTQDFVHHGGSSWESIPVLDAGSGGVAALAADGLGGVCAAGGFASIDGIPALAVCIRDGGNGWGLPHDPGGAQGLFSTVFSGASVTQIEAFGEAGHLVIGSFKGAHGELIENMAIWTGSAWQAAPFAFDGTPNAVLVGDTDVFVHDFAGLRRWSRDTQQWFLLGDPQDAPNGTVTTFALSADGARLYAGGYFWLQREGQTTTQNLAVWDRETNTWSPVGEEGPEAGVFGSLMAMELDAAGRLIIGGTFSSIDGTSATNVARWDGSSWDALGGGVDGTALHLLAQDGEIWAAGSFNMGGTASGLARYSPSGTWVSMDVAPGAVAVLQALPAGGLIVGGHFDEIGGEVLNGLALHDGSWHDLGADPQAAGAVGGIVQALCPHGETLLVGGRFHALGGYPASAFGTAGLNLAPGMVSGLSISVSNGLVQLDWLPAAGADSYVIRHFQSPWAAQEDGTIAGITNDTQVSLPQGSSNQLYFRVSASSSE